MPETLSTYLFRIVKARKQYLSQWEYNMKRVARVFDGISHETVGASPVIHRFSKTNDYLIDVRKDNIEFLRFIANTLIQAEMSILTNDSPLFVVVYKVKKGERITSKTPMTTFFYFQVNQTEGCGNEENVSRNTKIKKWVSVPTLGNNLGVPRHTVRGSGRYKAVIVYDPPRYNVQGPIAYGYSPLTPKNLKDDFIGLDIAFSRRQGKALKHVYLGCPNVDNYVLDANGNILLHHRGDLFDGALDSYRKSMQAVFPFFSALKFDKDGKLADAGKVVGNGIPNLVTEFKAQRRAAYSKGGNSEVFKARLFKMINWYAFYLSSFLNEIQAWGHNLNYDVRGFEMTFDVYLHAERITRLFAAYFPMELKIDKSKMSELSSIGAIKKEERLRLGNRKIEVAECFDALCKSVDWMRRNWISYQVRKPLPPHKSSGGGPKRYWIKYEDLPQYYFTRAEAEFFLSDNRRTIQREGIIRNVQGSVVAEESPFGGGHFRLNFSYEKGFDVNDSWVHSENYSDYNQWLEQTADIAADIEEVYLEWQQNALDLLDLVSHLFTLCDSIPLKGVKRFKGLIPGELERTKEQKLNMRRIYPRTHENPPRTGTRGQLKPLSEVPKPTIPLPDFKPYTIDARAIVKRCSKDGAKENENEEDEGSQGGAALDEAERRRIEEEKRIRDQKKISVQDGRAMRWRNEIDGIEPEVLEQERSKMYDQITDNLFNVVDGIDLAFDVVEVFTAVAAPEASPVVIAEHAARELVQEQVERVARPAIRELVEREGRAFIRFVQHGARDEATPGAIEIRRYEDPETGTIAITEYHPPRHSDETPFTGSENISRDMQPERVRDYNETPDSPERFNPEGPFYPREPIARRHVETIESGGGRELTQPDVRNDEDIPDDTPLSRRWTERRTGNRFRCVRGFKRIPRA